MATNLRRFYHGILRSVVTLVILVLAGCDWVQLFDQKEDDSGDGTALGALQNVEIARIPMDFTFHPGTSEYSGQCAYERTAVQFTLTLDGDEAFARINGTAVHSGQTHSTNLSLGDNRFEIQDAEKTYTVSIYRKSVSDQLSTPCPNYPIPGHYDGEISSGTQSEVLIVEEGIIKDYHPYLAGCAADSWDFGDFGKDEDPETTIVSGFGYDKNSFGFLQTVNDVTLVLGGGDWEDVGSPTKTSSAPMIFPYDYPLPLVRGGTPVHYEGIRVTAHWDLGQWNPVASYHRLFSSRLEAGQYRTADGTIPISDLPRLRRIRHWDYIMSDTIGSGSTQLSKETSWGVERTHTEFFIEATVDADLNPMDWLDLSGTLLEITAEGFSESVTLTEHTSETVARTADSIEGATSTTVVLWQLVEEFHIVDSSGNEFSDSFYEIDTDRSPLKLVNRLETFAVSTVPFF